jgi:hypothetical protein
MHKELFKHFILEVDSFTLNDFRNILRDNLNIHSTYSIIIKLCSIEDQVYKMTGRQIGFQLTDMNIDNLYNTILARVDMISELYGIEKTIRAVDIMYKVIKRDVAIRDINKLKLDKNLVRIKEVRKNFNFKLLPLSTNTQYYGRSLLTLEREE